QLPTGLDANQLGVANALTHSFNAAGDIPMVYGALTPRGLTLAAGELGTGTQQTTLDAMNLFTGVLADPFVAGRGDGLAVPPTTAPQWTDEDERAVAFAPDGKPRRKA